MIYKPNHFGFVTFRDSISYVRYKKKQTLIMKIHNHYDDYCICLSSMNTLYSLDLILINLM
jgi:hypothetical protein